VAANSPPWTFPLDTVSVKQNTSSPPTTQANAIKNYSPPRVSVAPPRVNEVRPRVNEAPPRASDVLPQVHEAPLRVIKHKKNHLGPGGIAFMIGGGTLMATGVALFVAIRWNKLRLESPNFKSSESNHGSFHSHPTSATIGNSHRNTYGLRHFICHLSWLRTEAISRNTRTNNTIKF